MLILASSSPRRKELLKIIYPSDFKIIPSNADESKAEYKTIEDLPLETSKIKGLPVSLDNKGDYVLSADTIVIFRGEKFGKPKDEKDAFSMLSRLSNQVHYVITGYSIFKSGVLLKSNSVKSALMLLDLDKDTINKYIATKSPFDKAGAYGVQDKEYIKSKLISGSEENVMGLPIQEIKKDLEELGLIK